MIRTKVGIVGAGPAGLMLAHLLARDGISSVIVERKSRAYCEARRRAGLMEHGSVQILKETGVGDRLSREALVHDGVHIAFDGATHRIDFTKLVGKQVYIYDQKDVVTDLIACRLGQGGEILFEAEDVALHDVGGASPRLTLRHGGKDTTIACDFIAGCDGFHGVSRASIGQGTQYARDYPFAWLGILADSPPPEKELIYAWHPRGFALFSMRTHHLSRSYLQCAPDEDIKTWPDARIWDELEARLGGARSLTRGDILQKSIAPMRGVVHEPMQDGRLFLAGDAAHIVPPTGAKGMNLAFTDICVLAQAFADHYGRDDETRLKSYSETCLRRVWKAQRFSSWMTGLLHIDPQRDAFELRRQRAELDYLAGSQAAMTAFAENYCGLPLDI